MYRGLKSRTNLIADRKRFTVLEPHHVSGLFDILENMNAQDATFKKRSTQHG